MDRNFLSKTRVAASLLMLMFFSSMVLAAAGDLDTSFNPGSGANNYVYTSALQADGKIIIGGDFTSMNGTVRSRIARLNPDGSVDSSFNPGTGANNYVYTSAVQADGTIIIGGNFSTVNSVARIKIARLHADGSLDSSFNPGTGTNSDVKATAVQADGKIIIGGQFTTVNGVARNYIARLNADGSLDGSFNPGTGASSVINATAVQPDGKVIIGGWFATVNGVARNYIARLNANGSLDNSFNSGANGYVSASVMQSDGKIVIGGNFSTVNGVARSKIARLHADGSLDSSFNPGTGPNNTVNTSAVQADGKIVIGGNFTTVNGVARNYIARLNVDGSLDSSFNPGTGASGVVYTSTVQVDGKLIIGGRFTTVNGVARNRIARIHTGDGDNDGVEDAADKFPQDPTESTDADNDAIGDNADTDDDNDAVLDAEDNCPINANTDQLDIDGDALGNACDTDDDNDGVPDTLDAFPIDAAESADADNDGVGDNADLDDDNDTVPDVSDNCLLIANTDQLNTDGDAQGDLCDVDDDNDSVVDTLDKFPFNFAASSDTDLDGYPDAWTGACDLTCQINSGLTLDNCSTTSNVDQLNTDGDAQGDLCDVDDDNDGLPDISDNCPLVSNANQLDSDSDAQGDVCDAAPLTSNAGGLDISFNPGTGASGSVTTSAVQADGKIIIGGSFITVNGVARNSIARLNADGSLDSSFNPGTYVDGGVSTSALQSDGKIIIGGNFTSIDSVASSRIARLNADGAVDASFNSGTGANGTVLSSALQSDGKIVIGGEFTWVDSAARYRIARLNADGSLDSSFNPGTGVSYSVRAIALQTDGKIVIGGSFTTVNGVAHNRVARLNADGSLDSSFNPGTGASNTIYTISVQVDGKIVIGGSFTTVNGVARNRVARLNADGSLDSSFNPGTGVDNSVNASALQADGKIIIGGSFIAVNGVARNSIARLNTDGSVDSSFNPGTGLNYNLMTIAVQPDGKVIIGGQFTTVNGIARNRFARIHTGDNDADGIQDAADKFPLDPTEWFDNDSDGIGNNADTNDDNDSLPDVNDNCPLDANSDQLDSDGDALGNACDTDDDNDGVIDGSDYYLLNAAVSSDVDGDGFPDAWNVACDFACQSNSGLILDNCPSHANTDQLDTDDDELGNVCDSDDDNDGLIDDSDNCPLISNADQLDTDGDVQGDACDAQPLIASGGTLDTSFDPGTGANNTVYTSAVQADGKIIIGGDFTTVNGTARNRIARLNPDGSVDGSFNPGSGSDGSVYHTAVLPDGKIIISGEFWSVSGVTHNSIARLNTDGSLDSSFDAGVIDGASGSSITVVAFQTDGKIIIGGHFTSVNGVAHYGIARLNANGSVDDSFNPEAGGVESIALQADGKIIIGGGFWGVNGVPRKYIARLSTDGSLDTSFDPGTGASNWVLACAVQADGKIIIGGYFTSVNGVAHNGIARLNADGSVDGSFNPDTSGVMTIAVQADGKMLIGGDFTVVNGVAHNGIARLSADGSLDSSFNPGSGAYGIVYTSAVQTDGRLVIGGSFSEVSGVVRNRIARTHTGDSDSDGIEDAADFNLASTKNDFDTDSSSDVLFLNSTTGGTHYWSGAVKASTTYPGVMDLTYAYKGAGDFDGDGSADIFFTRAANNGTLIWNGAVKASATFPGTHTAGFAAVAICDVNGDMQDDVVWHNATTGGTQIWPSASKAAVTYPGTQNTAFTVAACADFDGDGSADVFWRNLTTGGNEIWLSANKSTKLYPGANTDLTWSVIGAGDSNGNLNSDLIWYKASTGATQIWEGALKSASTYPGTNATTFTPKAIGDYDGDGSADLLWSNNSTLGTQIWPGVVKAAVTYPGTHASGFSIQK